MKLRSKVGGREEELQGRKEELLEEFMHFRNSKSVNAHVDCASTSLR